ncbi:cell division protein FtsQ/DivIB [Blastococcus sp. TF02A-30]|uniref:cell division protein FtsQ/DivIB n=1 Tax=Blastococcus sp. TF02A-30 TaxID=2250580 RepID=UPI000DEB7A8A|nr:FtsQ-type POTRA domain-containing protein [Blastococcus sp. TF02A-30]RBY85584.1 cell division protein FtsQ [Blastococcus sp. TF02A-30]
MSRGGATTRDRTRGARRGADRRGSGSVTPLPDRRRRRTAHPRRRRVVQAAAAVVGLIAVVWFLAAGPLLSVRSIQVDGAELLPAELVRETSGIDQGTPLLRVDVDAATARLAELPQVRSVTVTRGWPDRVVITLVERTPLAAVEQDGGRVLVDGSGVLFDTITGQPPAGVVPLEVAEPGPGDEATEAALAAIAALPGDLREQMAGATATGPEDVAFLLLDGTVVRWGSADESDRKAQALAGLVARIESGDLEPAGEIDVSAPGAVVLR